MRLKAFSWLSIALVLTAAAVVVLRSNTPNNRFEEFITASSARSAAAATAHLPEARKQHVLGSLTLPSILPALRT